MPFSFFADPVIPTEVAGAQRRMDVLPRAGHHPSGTAGFAIWLWNAILNAAAPKLGSEISRLEQSRQVEIGRAIVALIAGIHRPEGIPSEGIIVKKLLILMAALALGCRQQPTDKDENIVGRIQ